MAGHCIPVWRVSPSSWERRVRRVSKDGCVASWFGEAQERLLTMRRDSHQIGLLRHSNNGVLGRAAYRLQSCASLSSAWDRPFSENMSVVSVPLADTPLMVASAALRMASTIRSSSAAFLIQSPSPWVYIA